MRPSVASPGMTPYRNRSGDSGIRAYRIAADAIEVEFATGTHRIYGYTYLSAGRPHVERMKALAVAGRGLNTYINRHTADRYAWRR